MITKNNESKLYLFYLTLIKYLSAFVIAFKSWKFCKDAIYLEANYRYHENSYSYGAKLLARTYNVPTGQTNIWLNAVMKFEPNLHLALKIIGKIAEQPNETGPFRIVNIENWITNWIQTQSMKKKVVEAAEEITNTKGR